MGMHKRSSCGLLLLLVVVLFGWAVSCKREPAPSSATTSLQKPEAPKSDPSTERLSQIVAAYQKVIVLLESEETMGAEERSRATTAGEVIYHENHQRLMDIGEQFGQELEAMSAAGFSNAPPNLNRFLDYLERSPELHDADKLVFREVVEDASSALHGMKTDAAIPAALRARLDDDLKSLQEIQSLYDKELERIIGRFHRRGMVVRREAWDAYLAYLKTRYSRARILQEYASAIQNIAASRNGRDSALVTYGKSLPPKTLILTFDDGPHLPYTDRILEILNKFQVKSIFFELGENLGSRNKNTAKPSKAALASQHVLDSGSVLANHSYSHPLMTKLSDQEIADELERTNRALQYVAQSRPVLFRPPYGATNAKLMAALQARQMKAVLWDIDSEDWADPIPKSIANRVLSSVDSEGRGIILFHDIHERTVEALPEVLSALQTEGYQFASWDGRDFVVPPPEASRGITGSVQETAPPPIYRESWAVLIGIDDYRSWPKLRYAARDAAGMKDLLIQKYKFKPECITTLLDTDATRNRILTELGDAMANPEKVKKEDRVFIFFAGHGATRRLPSGRDLGYIVPYDADLQNYQGQAISMTNFQDISESIPARHVVFVMDACYSGLALTRGVPGLTGNYFTEMSRRTARQMLTAGGADEQVADTGPNGHSVFTWTLMQGLEGRADLNGDGFITVSELASYAGPIVSSLSHQTPAFGNLAGSEGGEFLFELRHENEFLSGLSTQLDEEAIQLNGELDRIREEIASKRARNQKLQHEVASARSDLHKLEAPPKAKAGRTETSSSHNDLGLSLFKEKKYESALQEFAEAARMNPSNVQAINNAGFVCYKLGKFVESTQWLEKTIALDPNRAIAYVNLGDAYVALNRKEDARRSYESCIKLAPNTVFSQSASTKLAALNK